MKRFQNVSNSTALSILVLVSFFVFIIGGVVGHCIEFKTDNNRLIIKVYDHGEVLNIISKNKNIVMPKSEVSQVYYMPNNTGGAYVDFVDTDFSDHVIKMN